MPHDGSCDKRNVCLNDMPKADPAWTLSPEEEDRWERLLKIRGDVNKALESARAEKKVGKPLDAAVTLHVSGAAEDVFAGVSEEELAALCIVSELTVHHGEGQGVRGEVEGLSVEVEGSTLPKCQRCWCHSATVDENGLCRRCGEAIAE